jgi:hypothetical protein
MEYQIEVKHRQESTDGKIIRDDIVISKVFVSKMLGTDIDHVIQSGLISFPRKDLQNLIEKLQEKLTC